MVAYIARGTGQSTKSIFQGSAGYTIRIRRLYNKDQEVISKIFLISVLLSATVEKCFVSRMRDFFKCLKV